MELDSRELPSPDLECYILYEYIYTILEKKPIYIGSKCFFGFENIFDYFIIIIRNINKYNFRLYS